MACRLVGVKPLAKLMLEYCLFDLRNKYKWNINQNSYIVIPENVFEKVCKMLAILS